MKEITFLGSSLDDLREFPQDARRDAGFALNEVQEGRDPPDWKPMKTVGAGVREVRVSDRAGIFRVIYVANLNDTVLVLHAFAKKTEQTAKSDIDLAKSRLKQWKKEAK